MSKSLNTVLAVAAGFIILWLFIEREKNRKRIGELQNRLDESEELTLDIKRKLVELINANDKVDPALASELGQIVALLEIKQEETAILKLAKIIENLLKELYKTNPDFKTYTKTLKSKVVLADYLEFAKSQGLFSKEDYHLLLLLKMFRNEEAHELNIKKERSRIVAVFIAGLSLVLGLCRMLKRNTVQDIT